MLKRLAIPILMLSLLPSLSAQQRPLVGEEVRDQSGQIIHREIRGGYTEEQEHQALFLLLRSRRGERFERPRDPGILRAIEDLQRDQDRTFELIRRLQRRGHDFDFDRPEASPRQQIIIQYGEPWERERRDWEPRGWPRGDFPFRPEPQPLRQEFRQEIPLPRGGGGFGFPGSDPYCPDCPPQPLPRPAPQPYPQPYPRLGLGGAEQPPGGYREYCKQPYTSAILPTGAPRK